MTNRFTQNFQVVIINEQIFRVFGARKQPRRTLNENILQECIRKVAKNSWKCLLNANAHIRRWNVEKSVAFFYSLHTPVKIICILMTNTISYCGQKLFSDFFFFLAANIFFQSRAVLIGEVRIVFVFGFFGFFSGHIYIPIFRFLYFKVIFILVA